MHLNFHIIASHQHHRLSMPSEGVVVGMDASGFQLCLNSVGFSEVDAPPCRVFQA